MYEAVARSYRQTSVLSSDPPMLVRMCYEGAIVNLKLSRDAYIARDYEAKGKALLKTLDIIHELNVSLDMKRGGDVAKNLRALYLYMGQALTEADLKKDLKVFDAVIRMLEELASAWKAIVMPAVRAGDAKPRLTETPLYGAARPSTVAVCQA